ncbi:MAG TPA: hypothetical protein VIJ38_18565 [Acidobacteriaceae bacterium]
MKRLVSFVLTLFTGVCFLMAMERQAMAYVDPGTGLLALQSFASVMAAAMFFLRRRIMGLFKRNKPQANVATPVTVQKEDSRNTA